MRNIFSKPKKRFYEKKGFLYTIAIIVVTIVFSIVIVNYKKDVSEFILKESVDLPAKYLSDYYSQEELCTNSFHNETLRGFNVRNSFRDFVITNVEIKSDNLSKIYCHITFNYYDDFGELKNQNKYFSLTKNHQFSLNNISKEKFNSFKN